MRGYGQFCPIALAAEIFAQRWTPIIIRNLYLGCSHFGDILDGAGDPLMMERDVAVLGLDKARIEADQVVDSARAVAALAEVDADSFVARAKAAGLRAHGLDVSEMVPLVVGRTPENSAYLRTKAVEMGHLLAVPDDDDEYPPRHHPDPHETRQTEETPA